MWLYDHSSAEKLLIAFLGEDFGMLNTSVSIMC